MPLRLLAGIPNRREVWAWGMYDLANQSFTLLINTLLFAIFFKEVVLSGSKAGDAAWGAVASASLLVVVLLSPVLGALADQRAWKKRFLIGTGAACVVLTCSLALLPAGWVWLAVLLYVPANIAFNLGENFLAAFLPEIARMRDLPRVSALGWSMGYVGALILIGLTALIMTVFGLNDPARWRPLFVFTGLWFLVMATPTALFLKERARPQPGRAGAGVVRGSFERLAGTFRHAARYAHLLRFLGAFFVYAMGVQAVIFFAAVIAGGFGFTGPRLALFLLPATVTAGIGAVAAGLLHRRIGHRSTIFVYLAIWIVTTLLLLTVPKPAPGMGAPAMLWVVSVGVGAGLGGIGTASRAIVGAFTPAHKTAEFFGLWGLAYKSAGVVGVVLFGVVKSLSETAAFALLASEFILGGLILLSVSEMRGIRSARRDEREHVKEIDAADRAAAARAMGSVVGAAGPQGPG